jgi:hypothetical protein
VKRARVRIAVVALLAALPAGAAQAGSSATLAISVSPTTVRLGETMTVTGTSDCDSAGYSVRLEYTDNQDNFATVTVNGTTDAAGEFTQALTMPETGQAHTPASVTAVIPDCSSGSAASNRVDLTVAAYQGAIAVDRSSAPPGTEVGLSGSNCYGGRADVRFTGGGASRVVNVTLASDRTFSGVYTIPEGLAPGGYAFEASCPGTDFASVPFQVEATPVVPTQQAPATIPAPPPVPADPCPPGNSAGVSCTPRPGGGFAIVGTGGGDRLVGSSGPDLLYGDGGTDRILALAGADRGFGLAGDDVLIGGPGNDLLSGGDGDDRAYGLTGDDTVAGGRGGDALAGGDGDDSLLASRGDDRLGGGRGVDTLLGAGGLDAFFAGGGIDLVRARDGRGGETISCGGGPDRLDADADDRPVAC